MVHEHRRTLARSSHVILLLLRLRLRLRRLVELWVLLGRCVEAIDSHYIDVFMGIALLIAGQLDKGHGAFEIVSVGRRVLARTRLRRRELVLLARRGVDCLLLLLVTGYMIIIGRRHGRMRVELGDFGRNGGDGAIRRIGSYGCWSGRGSNRAD